MTTSLCALESKPFLEENSSWIVEEDFGDPESCIKYLKHTEELPDTAIVDVDLGNESGFDLVQEISKAFPSIKCVMYSMHEEKSLVKKALDCGAKGYVSKACNIKEFLICLKKVEEGEIYCLGTGPLVDLETEIIGR